MQFCLKLFMTQINGQLLEQFWQFTKLYWSCKEQIKAKLLLVLLIILSIFSSSFLVGETLQRGEVISSLAVRDSFRFWRTIGILSFIIAGVILCRNSALMSCD